MIALDLFWRFVLISLLAFGGGQAALPLVERITVVETGWVTAQDFSTALAFTYITPGPVLILSTVIGYRAAGFIGALAATLGAFVMAWLLAAGAAHQLQRFLQHPWLGGFGRGAGPAVVGLLGVTALGMARDVVTGWPYGAIAVLALALAVKKVHPFAILVGCGLASVALSSL